MPSILRKMTMMTIVHIYNFLSGNLAFIKKYFLPFTYDFRGNEDDTEVGGYYGVPRERGGKGGPRLVN